MSFGDGNAAPAPRVYGSKLADFEGRTVTLVGKVHSWNSQQALLQTSTGETITIIPAPGSDYSSTYVEVIGKVMEGGAITEFKCTHFGDNFDLAVYDKMVELANTQYKELFL